MLCLEEWSITPVKGHLLPSSVGFLHVPMPLVSLAALRRMSTAARCNGYREYCLSDRSGLRARAHAIVTTRQFPQASGILISQVYLCTRKGLAKHGIPVSQQRQL